MNTRKPKPTFGSMIELPVEELQLQTIKVEAKPAPRGDEAEVTRYRATRVLPQRGKVTLD